MTTELKERVEQINEGIRGHALAFLDMTALNLMSLQQQDRHERNKNVATDFVDKQSFFIQAVNELFFDLRMERDLETSLNNFCGTSTGDPIDALDAIEEWNEQLRKMLRNAKVYLRQNHELDEKLRDGRVFMMDETANDIHELLTTLRRHYREAKPKLQTV